MRGMVFLLGGALLLSCGKNRAPSVDGGFDGGSMADATVTVDHPPTVDAGAEVGGLVGCLDLPNQLSRPPSDILPCDLVPPGLVLAGRQ